MKKEKGRRVLAFLLAVLCFCTTPLSVCDFDGQGCAAEAYAAEEKQEEEKGTERMEWEELTEKPVEKETEAQTESRQETLEEKQTEESSEKEDEKPKQEKPAQEKASPPVMNRAASDSIYLTCRSSAVKLNKSDAVIVGDVSTQLPAAYEGYVRSVKSAEINFKGKTFVPDSGPLKGKENCVKLTSDDKSRYYAWYRKSMYYQGQWIDIKMTLTNFKLRSGAYFRFTPARPGIESYKVEWANVRMEFFRSDNGLAVNAKGYLTFRDIDLFQGIVLRKGFGQVYAGKEALPNLKTAKVDGKDYYFDTTGINEGAGNRGHMLSALFQGTALTATYTFVRPENNVGTSLTPSGGITAQSYKIFASVHPNIDKKVSDSDEKLVGANTLSGRGESFTYTLTTVVPMETDNTMYKDWSVRDVLDDALEIKKVSVTDENGSDASGHWIITRDKQFEAKCRNIKNTEFYGHTYRFQITVGIRSTADLNTYWDISAKAAMIRNQAQAVSDGKTVQSQTVITKLPAIPASVIVEKADEQTKKPLDGARFGIYEWDGSNYGEVPAVTLEESHGGVYTSGKVLSYTPQNQGKFKIAEIAAPKGYCLNKWEKEFAVSGFSEEEISFRGENACQDEPQWIRIKVKKRDAATEKALEGAVFEVTQWSEEKGTYIPYLAQGSSLNKTEFSSDASGDGISPKLYYQADNQGKFRIQEIKAPKNYFGDYQKGEKKGQPVSYDFQIEDENAGKTLTLSNTEENADFINKPQTASITVRKLGEVLCGTEKEEEGIRFVYEEKPLAGAEYEILAAEDIYQADGVTLAFEKDAVVDKLVTGKDGGAVSRHLPLGKYKVVETKAPAGYVLGETKQDNTRMVELSYQGQETEFYLHDETKYRNERPKISVTVWKKSKETKASLAGAVFGLYTAEDILLDGAVLVKKDTLIEKALSRQDGSCCFGADIPCGGSYYVKELQAPEGYYKQTEKEAYIFHFTYRDDRTRIYTFPEKGKEEEAVFYDKEVYAEISLQKLDQDSGLAIPQQGASLKGAVYGLYAKEAILAFGRKEETLFEKDQEVAREITDEKGRLCFSHVPLGSYYIRELKASEGYLLDPQRYDAECTYDGQETNVVTKTAVSYERVKKQRIRYYKLTGDNKETDLEWLLGAGFSVFSVLELEKEKRLPEGSYTGLSDEELVQKIMDTYRDKKTLDYKSMRGIPTATVYAEEASEEVKKGLLTREVVWSDGTTYQVQSENPREFKVNELTSDEKGVITTCSLPYGRYLLVETSVPEGKVAAAPKVITVSDDENDRAADGDGEGVPAEDYAIWDQPVTSYLKITKRNAFTQVLVEKPGAKYVIHDIEGAYFNWYMKDKTSEEKLDYLNRFGNLAVAYTNGEIAGSYENPYATAKRKNDDGKYIGTYVTTTEALPEGMYILEEVSAPEGYVRQGCEGTYRKANGKTFFEAAMLHAPSWEAVQSLKITEKDVGKWAYSEKASKDQRIKVKIGPENPGISYDRLAGAFVTEVFQENEPAVGKLSIYAEGEYLSGWNQKKGFSYRFLPAEGSTFLVRAAENIYSGEGGPGETLLFAKGSVVARLVTDEEGKAWTEKIETSGFTWNGLPLGVYTVEQEAAAEGFVLTEKNRQPKSFEISYAGEEVPILYQDAAYQILRRKVEIHMKKKDAQSQKAIAGAVFGLYAGQDIMDAENKKVLAKKDTLLGKAETVEADGCVRDAVFDLGLPPALYYVKEEQAPSGYASSGAVCEIDARSQQKEGEVLEISKEFENQQTLLQINLMDYDTEEELDGASLVLLDEEGKTIQSIVTVHEGNALIRGLEVGKHYRVQTLKARTGYSRNFYTKEAYHSPYSADGVQSGTDWYPAEELIPDKTEEKEAQFTVKDTNGVQVISLFHKAAEGELTVQKEGEVPKTELRDGRLERIYYEKEGLPQAEYDVFAEETVVHPDGYSGTIFEAGEKLGHLVTDATGTAVLGGLYPGRYRVAETKAPEGYSRDRAEHEKKTEISWKDGSVQKIETKLSFENPRQIPDIGTDPDDKLEETPKPDTIYNDELKGKTGIVKTGVDVTAEGAPETALAGAEFTLYAKKDVTDVKGKVVLPAGTEIERAVSDANGRVAFLTELPMGCYIVKETKAADGYYCSRQEVVFDFEPYKREDRLRIVRMQGEVKNALTAVRLFLRDDLTGNELAGAVIQILDEDGTIHTAVTTKNTEGEGHLIKGLIPGKVYRIREMLPRKGYVAKLLIPKEMEGVIQKEGEQEGSFSIPDIAADVDPVPEVLKLELQNRFMTGNVEVSKTGELLNHVKRTVNSAEGMFNLVKTWFSYLTGAVEKAEFTIRAAEDIYHPDGVTGLLYHAGDTAEQKVRQENEKTEAVAVTGAAGRAEFTGLYLGQYELEETNIPEGFRKNPVKTAFTLADQGEGREPVCPKEGVLMVHNERQQVEIQVIKRDQENPEKVLEGAVFGLYTKEDIKAASGAVLLEAETLLETQTTDENGTACFTAELPTGKYYIAELAAPDGYCLSSEILEVDASWKEDGIPVQSFRLEFKDKITRVNVAKKAQDTQEPLKGAELAVYQGSRCVERWTTDGSIHCVEGLAAGGVYTLRELSPAPGYVTAEDVEFTVKDAEEKVYTPQEIEMTDPVTKLQIFVYERDGDKKLPLGGVKAHLETIDGNRLETAEYTHGKDGVWESVAGEAEVWEKIPVGTYKAVVDKVPEGYVLPDTMKIEVKDTAELQSYEISVQPIRIRITGFALPSEISERQEEKTMIKGIYSHISGLFEDKKAELPILYDHVPAGSYQILTDKVPAGYVFPEKSAIKVRGDTAEIQDFEVVVKPTVIRITAVDKETQAVLDKVQVTVVDENGRKVWKKLRLPEGKERVIPAGYTIRTVSVPKGYEKPKDKKITVRAVTALQKFKIELEKKTEGNKTVVPSGGGGTVRNYGGDYDGDDDGFYTAARTGDASPIVFWVILLVVSFLGVLYLRLFCRKKRR